MSAVIAIRELARQVRASTIDLLQAAQPDWLIWAPESTSNHILWHAGHAVWLQDVLGLESLTGRRELPPDWDELFGMHCRPVHETAAWPSREEMLNRLAEQLDRLYAALTEAGDERLVQVIDPRGYTLASRVIHGLHDEARHQGEMYLLLKLCRARSGSSDV